MSSVSIHRAEATDAPDVQRIWAASFRDDLHTQFKAHEKGHQSADELPLDLIPDWIAVAPEKGMFLKAVDMEGKLVGWSSWGFYNLDGARAVQVGLVTSRAAG
jgi:hypothetical protein